MALQRAEETVSLDDNATGSSDTFAWFADILEKAGDTDRALRALAKVEEREPDPGGMQGYKAKVLNDHWSVEDVARELRQSAEYRSKKR